MKESEPAGVLRRWWWVVVAGTLVGALAAGGWAQLQEPVWESTTSVLVHPAGQDINVVGGRTQGQVNLDTEAQLVRSTAVATGAAEQLATAIPADELARQVTVQVPPNTSVLQITFAAPTQTQAQAGASAFAEAYLHHREQTAQAELGAQQAAVERKVVELTAALTDLNEQLTQAPPGSATAANLESRRSTVASQLQTMTGRLDELSTATVTAGTVISAARRPTAPSQPRLAIVLASGTALGLVLGATAAGLADRLTRRVRRPEDLPRRLGIPVLAHLGPGTAPAPDEIASPYGPAGRAYDRLRNEVLAERRDGTGGTGRRVIVVASPTSGGAALLTAANLAASIARSGHEVVLVGARTVSEPAAGSLPRLFGVADAPGLSEVVAGRVPLAAALQRSPRHPRLQVLTIGATATAAGLLQSPALRATFTALASQARYVVVDAPPTADSADAQSLASHADAALLVVERRRALLTDLADAADQLHRVGTPLLGAVVVPATCRETREPAGELSPGPRPDPDPGPGPGPGPDRLSPPDDRLSEERPGGGRPRPSPNRAPDVETVVMPRVVDPDPVATSEPAA